MITASQSRGEGGKSLEAFLNLKFYKCDCLIFIKLTVNFSVVSMRGGIYPLGWVWRDGRIEAWKMTDVGGWHTQVSWQLTVHIQASKCRENFCPESWQHEYEWKYAAYEVLRQSGMFKKKKQDALMTANIWIQTICGHLGPDVSTSRDDFIEHTSHLIIMFTSYRGLSLGSHKHQLLCNFSALWFWAVFILGFN